MTKLIFTFLLVVSGTIVLAQDPEAIVKEGTKLNDEGKYTEAVAKYDQALAIDPDLYTAHYEKALTLVALKRYDECIAICKSILKKHPGRAENAGIYTSYGNAMDMLGKKKEAIGIYDEGIAAYPTYGMLYFNKAITLANTADLPGAQTAIEQSIKYRPFHSSSHHVLAVINPGNKIFSLLGSLMYLAIDPYSERAAFHLKNVETILLKNVREDGEGITITVDALNDKKNTPNDFQVVELGMGLSSSLNSSEEFAKETKVERMRRNLGTILSIMDETEKGRKGFGWTHYAPFFAALNSGEHMKTFVHLMYATAEDKSNEEWLEKNEDSVTAFREWLAEYDWK